jgi:hypothetical protein
MTNDQFQKRRRRGGRRGRATTAAGLQPASARVAAAIGSPAVQPRAARRSCLADSRQLPPSPFALPPLSCLLTSDSSVLQTLDFFARRANSLAGNILHHACEHRRVVARSAQQVDIHRRAHGRRVPDAQQQRSFQDESVRVPRRGKPVKKTLHRVMLQQFVERPAGRPGPVQQAPANRCGDVLDASGQSSASRYGRMTFCTLSIAAYRIRASTLSRLRSR